MKTTASLVRRVLGRAKKASGGSWTVKKVKGYGIQQKPRRTA